MASELPALGDTGAVFVMRSAVVTGNSKGIGLAISESLRKDNVVVHDVSRTCGIDVTIEEDMCFLLELVYDVDILCNNVGGIGSDHSLWELCFPKNCAVMIKLTQKFLERKREWGRVITISSIYGKEKGPNPCFAAAKAAQIAYMKSLAGKYPGITFNTVCPGHIDVGKPFPDMPTTMGNPQDVANVVTFLCSDKSAHVNGACITVDGGESHSF